jgi:hypothetical protein
VLADISLSLPHQLDHRIDSCAWDLPGRRLCVCATDGHLWAYEVEDVSGVEAAPTGGLSESSAGRRANPAPGGTQLANGQGSGKGSGKGSNGVSRTPSGGQLTAAYRL